MATIETKQIELTYPDGSKHAFESGVTGAVIAAQIGQRLASDAVAVKVDGQITDLNAPIQSNATFSVITPKNREGELDADALYCIRHSCAHVMAEAICNLWPETQLVYGPPVDDGFYYDIDLEQKISTDDFIRIEKEMQKIVDEKRPFTRLEMSRDEGMAKLTSEGSPYKIDNAERAEGDVLSFYVTGQDAGKDFEDLCRGPHVPHTGKVGAFKIMSVAGSYWHGDASQKQLQRVYGTAFPNSKALNKHLARLEEARKRDHRVIGKKFALFTISPLVGQGLPLWMPNGAIIRTELQNLMQEELTKRDYLPVFTPHIGSVELYKKSGHFPYYKDSQFPTLKDHDSGCCSGHQEEYLLKPMNCPHHIQIYAAQMHSYRELPIRLAEFGTVYRYEQSGELNGLTRVRGFTQDDAHIFCTQDQVEEEFRSTLEMVQCIFAHLGLNDFEVQLSLRDPADDKYTGDPANWDRAEEILRRLANEMDLKHTEVLGEAAFYGPKIDFMVKDCIDRKWQLGTVQLDYNLPERFELTYIGSDNQKHRPVMIHRAPFGSFERFVGILIEHFAGSFPLWLSPTQVQIATITSDQNEYAVQTAARIKNAGFRVATNLSKGKINGKVADFEKSKTPYLLVVGEREASQGQVAVRAREKKNLGTMSLEAFIASALKEVETKSLELKLDSSE